MKRARSRWPLLLAGLMLLGMAACATVGGTTSVTLGFGAPAPWGSVTIGTAVPIGYGW